MGRRVLSGIALVCLLALSCSKKDAPSAASAPPSEVAPSASATPLEPPAPPPPTTTPMATATATATPTPTTHAPSPAPKPALRPNAPESTPAPDHGQKRISVHTNNRYVCTGGDKNENVLASPEPRGARITITGQGPCPGEVHDWAAEVSASRIDVMASHGTPSKCRCLGTGDIVLRGLDPGTYDVHVNGGFDRPIATRIVVLQ